MHDHVRMLLEDSKYVTFSSQGKYFIIPLNPGAYPTTVNAADSINQACQVREHKIKVTECSSIT